MENQNSIIPVITSLTEAKQEIPLDASKKKLSYKDRFLLCRLAHTRINRMGFFMNVFLMIVVVKILAYIPIIFFIIKAILSLSILLFIYMISIQILKRCHDFGNKGYIILVAFIGAVLFALFGAYISLYLGFFYIVWMSGGIVVHLPLVIISCYLLFKSGDPEDNVYGKSSSL